MAKKPPVKPAKPKTKATKGAKKASRSKAKPATQKVRKAPPPRVARPPKPSRVEVFVKEYLVDLNGRQAAIRAGYSAASARQTASELLATARVQELLGKAMAERAKRTGITADRVLQRLWAIGTADPRELMEVQRRCCRYCWGKGHLWQYTPAELAAARAEHEVKMLDVEEDKRAPFDEQGGIGWDPRNDPSPDCPECFGEGVERVVVKDTRDLSPEAAALFAGVKVTQTGIEIKMHDQPPQLVNVGRHLGLFKDRLEHTGANGAPLQAGVVVVPAKAPSQPAPPAKASGEPKAAKQPPPPSPVKPFKVRQG